MENNKIYIKIWDKTNNKFLENISPNGSFLNNFINYNSNGIIDLKFEDENYMLIRSICKKDKHDNQIFEGDILKGYVYPFMSGQNSFQVKEGTIPEFNYYLIIRQDEENNLFYGETWKAAGASVMGLSNGSSNLLESLDLTHFEKIGNIFENSNLLENYLI